MNPRNNNPENENTWTSWATGKLAMFAIGLAAGWFLYQTGMIQKVTGKLFNKGNDDSRSKDNSKKDY